MERFLIIRLSSLGDIIHTLPAYAALRRAFPDAVIRWAVEEKGKEILDLVPGIDEVAVIDKARFWHGARLIKDRDQTALDFQGLVKSALLAYLSRSRRRLGFAKKNLREPLAGLFYTERAFPIPEEEIHVIAKNLKLLEPLGIMESRFEFPLRIPEDISQSVRSKLAASGLREGQKIVVFNVGAAWQTKRWAREKWAESILRVGLTDAFPVLLWGSDEEKTLAGGIAEKTGVPIAPFLSIQEVIALLRSAALLVSGDTFALQAACALDVPVVALFGPTSPRRNGPFRDRDKALIREQDCSPCYKHDCSPLRCMQALSPEDVAAAIREALGKA
ncbi:MAG: rfaQ 2 [Candidatus Aminicenantes bacterium]|nr:rfaQ 2 [Candidatus Aminicenantes bacterium]